jgi:glycosyltransferase involved in cell wall biosynthesis
MIVPQGLRRYVLGRSVQQGPSSDKAHDEKDEWMKALGSDPNAPHVSVVIPCRDDTHLPGTLASLAAQNHASFEVIVVDDSGHDPAHGVDHFRDRLELRVVSARHGAAAGENRNAGVAVGRSDLVLFVDADDTVNDVYVRSMVDALQAHPFVCSRVDVLSLNPWNPRGTHPQETGLITGEMDFLPFAGAGTLGIRRSLFMEVGGFDPSLRVYEEADFCWRLQLAGHEAPSLVPAAELHYRLGDRPSRRLRSAAARGMGEAVLFRRYRRAGMPRQTLGQAAAAWWSLSRSLFRELSGHRAGGLGWAAATRAGRLAGSLRYRVPYF